ncbi:hypothetical protein B4064_1244 [Caldibacillus thermoamylovorans]|nr:hypothetical protein B4064_1244 [Caldibacillus thermoamylovorans]
MTSICETFNKWAVLEMMTGTAPLTLSTIGFGLIKLKHLGILLQI